MEKSKKRQSENSDKNQKHMVWENLLPTQSKKVSDEYYDWKKDHYGLKHD